MSVDHCWIDDKTECSNFTYHPAVLRNVSTWRGNDKWESIATEYDLVCSQNWLNKLMSTLGMAGLFVGAACQGSICSSIELRNFNLMLP